MIHCYNLSSLYNLESFNLRHSYNPLIGHSFTIINNDSLESWKHTSRNWLECNHYICDYMWLLIICNYLWTFFQLFLVFVIFLTILQLVCIVVFVLPCEQHFVWVLYKNNNSCPISCKCDQFRCSPMSIQRCILCI